MTLFRKALFSALLSAACAAEAVAEGSGDWIRHALADAAPATCGQEASAAHGTLRRLEGVELPETGKVIVINIPAGILTAYEDGIPVIESRAVVGQPSTPTPEMSTHVTFVRPNPTWTVPESIIARKGWREKLAEEPGFFDANGFDIDIGGRMVSPLEAAADPSSARAFVQRPGRNNALGLVKIGLHDSDAIYIHDTNDPGKFESEVRSASSGCVRAEQVRDLSAWILGMHPYDMDALIDSGDVSNHTPPERVSVVFGYWTAWPDATGNLRYYPDIYGLDEPARECMQSDTSYEPTPERRQELHEGGQPGIWTEYVTR